MLAKRLVIIALCAITLMGVLFIGNSLVNQIACEGQPINNNVGPTPAQQILGDRIIGQTFVAAQNNLNRVDIFFQTYQRHNTHDVNLRLLEVEAENSSLTFHGEEVVNITFNAKDISDQSWRSFLFTPIAHSASKTYIIVLRSPDSEEDNAITVGGIEQDSYAPGTAFFGNIPVSADIAFRSCYQLTASEKLTVLTNQLTNNRPGMWGNAAFYWLAISLYILLLLGFFWLLARWAW